MTSPVEPKIAPRTQVSAKDDTSIITVELFSGTGSFSKVADSLGFSTFKIDNDAKLFPDLCKDILDLNEKEIGRPDILWASPPCQTFSVASISHYWKDGKPKNDKALKGIAILEKTIELIARSKPKYWFIENPRGMMRKVIDEIFAKYGITEYQRNTLTYCQYGAKIMKPTDIWTNCSWWKPLPACKNGSPCHERAGRGARTGVQGIYNLEWERTRGNTATARGVIPPKVFEQIFEQMP